MLQNYINIQAKFCGICLRLEAECSLKIVPEDYLNKFLMGVQLQHNFICSFCNKQVHNAFQLYKTLEEAQRLLSSLWQCKNTTITESKVLKTLEADLLCHKRKSFTLHVVAQDNHSYYNHEDAIWNCTLNSPNENFVICEELTDDKDDVWNNDDVLFDQEEHHIAKLEMSEDVKDEICSNVKLEATFESVSRPIRHRKPKKADKKKMASRQKTRAEYGSSKVDSNPVSKPSKTDTMLKKWGVESSAQVTSLVEMFKLSETDFEEEIREKISRPAFEQAQYRCNLCVVTFSHPDTFDQHQLKHSPSSGTYRCEVCSCYYRQEAVLKSHMNNHFTRYRCLAPACDFVRPQKRTVLAHVAYAHCNFVAKCPYCTGTFKGVKHLESHIRFLHEKVTGVHCEECGAVMKSKQALRTHRQSKHLSGGIRCATCGLACGTGARLAAHRLRAHGAGGLCCDECGHIAPSRAKLNQHRGRHHVRATDKVICDYCQQSFRAKIYLAHHIKWQHEHKGLQCPHCDKILRDSYRLSLHVRVRHDKIPLPKNEICEHCGKGFTTKVQLANHRRTHTGERPFACTECHMTFAQKSTLQTHVKLVHLGLARKCYKKNKR